MRAKGWEQALAAVTTAAMAKPHAWGSHDCALFAADCVAVVIGEDFAADLRGTYDTENGARRVLVSLGCHNVGDLASRYLPEIDPTEAQRGDVVMIKGELGPFLAIVDGRTAVGPAARGLTHTPVSAALRAWRVG
jgi:hypothetical protein